MTPRKAPTLPVSPLEILGSTEMAPYRDNDVESVPSERDGFLSQDDTEPCPKPDPHRRTRIKLYIAVFIANTAFQILGPAQTQLFEQIFCQQYYREHDPTQLPSSGLVPEDQCKNATIQRQLAQLRSWYECFDALPALIMSIPLGIAMDTIGRRPLLLTCLCTVALQQFWIAFVCTLNGAIPLQAVWLAPLLNFFSGGLIVLQMVFMCLICDVTSKETLASSLFRIAAVAELTKVLGPVLAGGLMQFNVWWAIILGLAGLLVLIAVSWTVPETLIIIPRAEEGTSPASNASAAPSHLLRSRLSVHRLFATCRTGLQSLSVIYTSSSLMTLVLLMPLTSFGATLPDVLQQYISVRYNWTLANATFIFSLQGVAATFSLFLLLPWFSRFLSAKFPRALSSPSALNATVARISLLVISLAWALEGLAPNVGVLITGLAIETLGFGGGPAMKALAATLVEPKDTGRVFSILAVAQVLSTVVAHPLTAMLFGLGLDKGGGIYLGIPCFVAATLTTVAAGVLCLVSFSEKKGPDEDNDDHGGRTHGPIHL